MPLRSPGGFALRALVFVALALPAHLNAAQTWRPITEEDRNFDVSGIDATAGAVVLLREISADDSDLDGTVLDYYIRKKVLTAQGVEAMDKIEIPFMRGRAVRDLAARVIKPNGTIVEVDKKSFYTREIIRVGKEAISVKAFAFPGLEPGCIAEYRYRMKTSDALGGLRVDLYDTVPVALVRVRMRPFEFPGLGMKVIWHNSVNVVNKGRDKKDYYVFEGRNIPVPPDEPYSPPDEVIKPWLAFYFTLGDSDAHWAYTGGELAAIVRESLKPTKPLVQAAESITAGATTSEQKIELLYEHCRTKIKNLSYDACGYTPDQIESLKPNKSPADVLKNGYGYAPEINLLFAGLLRALKAECHLAYCGDRSTSFFDRTITMRSTLPDLLVALKVGSWRFYDPGALYEPKGQLQWRNEGAVALVADSKYYEFIDTPRSPPEYSGIRREARLRLDESGTLAGDVTITLTGHEATAAKHLYDTKSADERLEMIRAGMAERLGKVEVSDCVVLNATDPNEPVTITCTVRAEGYAEMTGGRMFVQPAFFQKGLLPRFSAAKRKFNIYFSYPVTEEDKVTIDLPAGFEREVPSVPKSFSTKGTFTYFPRVNFTDDPSQVVYQRTLALDILLIDVEHYAAVKAYFAHAHKEDAYTVTLKRTKVPTAVAPTEAP